MGRETNLVNHRFAKVPVNQIACYAKNPRVIQNPEYERLKNSLRQNGIDMPLVVTREPGAEHYVLQAGGNTRLSIAQSLYDAGSEEFATIPCVVKDWTSEIDVLVSHLRENDMRGNLMFIERALGVMSFAKMISVEFNRSFSQRELCRRLFEFGYVLSQPVISAMEYAVNRLYGLLPTALEHGMGKRQVTAIRMLEHSAIKVWDQNNEEEAGEFADLFTDLCKSCDGSVFDLEELISKVAHEISVASEVDANTVRMLLESERRGSPMTLEVITPLETDTTRKSDEDYEPRPFDAGRAIQKLRSKLVESCIALADSFELRYCVAVIPEGRFGYFMCELPKHNSSVNQRAVWKLLATACDQGRASKRVLLKLLADESAYAQKLQDSRPRVLHANLSPIDLFDLGERLLQGMDDVAWSHTISLLTTYRELKRLATELSLNLWEDAE